MADQTINWQLVIQGLKEATKDVDTLKRKLKEVQDLKDKAYQTGNTNAYNQLAKLEEELYRKRSKIEADFTKQRDKAHATEMKQYQKVADEINKLIEKKHQLVNSWNYDSTPKGNQLEYGSTVKQSGYSNPALVAQMKEQFATLPMRQSDINQRWADNYYSNYGKNMQVYAENAKKLKVEAAEVTKQINQMGNAFADLEGKGARGITFMNKMRSHFFWLLSGAVLASIISVPYEFVQTLSTVEQQMAGMKQVNEGLAHSQAALNNETMRFLDIAALYGEKIEDITEAGKLWGRAYKDLNIVNTLVHQSAVLSVADNFSIIEANKSLEAAMFQYGLIAKDTTEAIAYSSKVVDIWTKIAHNAQVSAQDLSQGVERAGSVAHMTGVDFEFLNSMIASGVRATGRTGAEIGQTIKTVLGSFHSKKAVKELDKIGISVKQVGKDGQIEFRKAQDVLLDLAITAQGTNKNLEETFKHISGGKWQWSKVGAMLGDYAEFIRVWGESVNSAGFASEQVEMQLDTIARKMKMLIADTQKLMVSGGNAGLTQFLKEQIQSLDNFVVGLQRVSATTWQVAGYLTVLIPVVYSLTRAWTAYKIAVETADAAQMAMARKNFIILGLTLVGIAIYEVVQRYGALANAARKADEQINDSLALKAQELDMYQKQAEFIDSLISAHKKMSEQLASGTLSAEKAAQTQKNLMATEEELTKITGDQGIVALVTAGKYEEASNIEKNASTTKTNSIKREMSVLKDQQIEYTRQMIQSTSDRIDALKSETSAWGLWAQAQQAAMNQYAGLIDKQIAFEEFVQEHVPTSEEGKKIRQQSIDSAKAKRKALKDWKPASVTEEIDALSQELNRLQLTWRQQKLSNINFNPGSVGGNLVNTTSDDEKKKNDSSAYSNSPDSSQQRKRIETQAEYKRLLSDMTVTHKQYEEQLDNINSRESLFGKTLASTIDRFDLMKSRVQQLTSEQDNLTSARDKYQELLDEAMESDQEFQEVAQETIGNWTELTKEQRRAFALTHREDMENFRNIKQLLNYINELNEKIAETSKNTSKMANDLTKDQYGKTLDRDYQYSEHMKYLKDKMNLDKLEATNKFDPLNYLRLNQIELDSLYEQQKEHEDKIIDLEEEVNQAIEKEQYDLADQKRKLRNQEIMEYAQNAQKIKDLEYQKTAKVKEGLEGITSELLIQGNSWKDIWKRLWNGLAEDALKALFKIQNSTPSLLGSILGLFGGRSGGNAWSLSNGTKLDSTFGFSGKLFATGGVSRKPAIFGEDGEEVAIPVEKNTQNSHSLLKYAANKLGVSMGTQVVPYLKNPELAKESSVSVEVKQNQAHILELQRQNQLMIQQNQMIAQMARNGGNTTVLPIITQVSADQVLNILKENPDVLYNILGRHNSNGYR